MGRRYWPIVTISTPIEARSASVWTTSSNVSPIPATNPDLVVSPAAFARARTDRLRAYDAEGRTARWRRATVSMLWFRTSGRDAKTTSRARSSPRRSLMSASTDGAGDAAEPSAWIASMVAATWAAPPSSRSSRATIVRTANRSPMSATA